MRHCVTLWLSVRSRGRYCPGMANDSPLGPGSREQGRVWVINPIILARFTSFLVLVEAFC